MATTICSLWAQNISIRPRASRLLLPLPAPPKGDCAPEAPPLPADAALAPLPLAMDAAEGDEAGATDEGEESAAMGVAAAAAMAICC